MLLLDSGLPLNAGGWQWIAGKKLKSETFERGTFVQNPILKKQRQAGGRDVDIVCTVKVSLLGIYGTMCLLPHDVDYRTSAFFPKQNKCNVAIVPRKKISERRDGKH